MINFLKLWDKSADEYKAYSNKFPQYIKTNKKIVELSNIKDGDVVVDLACGTGITTKAILEGKPGVKKIYAIDFSKDMLRVAKDSINSDKVEFILSDAGKIQDFLKEKADIVFCNSTFWQFKDKDKVIREIRGVLKSGGRFIFNLNQQFFDFGQVESNQKVIMEYIFDELERNGFRKSSNLVSKVGEIYIKDLFGGSDLELVKKEIFDVGPRSLKDFLSFLKIPATATFFDGVPKDIQVKILNKAILNFKDEISQIDHNKWIYFVFKKV